MSDDLIHFGTEDDFVRIAVRQRGDELGHNAGNVRLEVEVRSGSFSGSYDHVWIAAVEWRRFIGDLARIEHNRSGSASMRSIAPEEFELSIEVISRAGRFAAHGHLARYNITPSKTTRSRIEYQTTIDPSLLLSIVRQLEK